jgi:hypothetical protein
MSRQLRPSSLLLLILGVLLWPDAQPSALAQKPAVVPLVGLAEAAGRAFAAAQQLHRSGVVTSEVVYGWSTRWMQAARQAGVSSARADHLRRMKDLEALVRQRHAMGVASLLDKLAAEYYRIEAETWAAGSP